VSKDRIREARSNQEREHQIIELEVFRFSQGWPVTTAIESLFEIAQPVYVSNVGRLAAPVYSLFSF
jgi:hypothetical protein